MVFGCIRSQLQADEVLEKLQVILGLTGYFPKEVLDCLRIWMNGQLRKGQGWDFKAMFFWDFWHLVNGGGNVRKNGFGLKVWEIS